MDISLLQQFYEQASESELAIEEPKYTFDYQEYCKHMINIKQAIRFFYEWLDKQTMAI